MHCELQQLEPSQLSIGQHMRPLQRRILWLDMSAMYVCYLDEKLLNNFTERTVAIKLIARLPAHAASAMLDISARLALDVRRLLLTFGSHLLSSLHRQLQQHCARQLRFSVHMSHLQSRISTQLRSNCVPSRFEQSLYIGVA
jgi:hypothetical protein